MACYYFTYYIQNSKSYFNAICKINPILQVFEFNNNFPNGDYVLINFWEISKELYDKLEDTLG